MKPGPLLAVPNFSEGRDYHFLRALRGAAEGIALHTLSWDVDHNRSVAALSGEPGALEVALLQMAALAFERIDLREHRGVHPRIGALDVLPIVPTAPEFEAEAHRLVGELCPRLAEFGTPIFLYGRSKEADLPAIRKGQFEGWVGRELVGDHAPDFGPPRLHPSLGASVVGVRGPLVAFNVFLSDPDPALAKEIAANIRAHRRSDPALRGVRAIGVPLESRGMSQVSMNLTDPDATDIAKAHSYVLERAQGTVAWCEAVGALRTRDLVTTTDMDLRIWPEQVLEY